ncbi:hypothetical protein P4B35_10935 [Pontiellaceae bacterium B12227]|nr:hypothetical protein [Pontiellaceae bacterium B12227]
MRKRSRLTIVALGVFLLTAGLASAITNVAVEAGYLNATSTWGVAAMPVSPAADGNVWATGEFKVAVETTPEIFWGGTLRLDEGGTLRPANSGVLYLKGDLHLNGGRIDGGGVGLAQIRMSDQTLILDSGTIMSGNSAVKDILIKGDGATASGSGTINVTSTQNQPSQVDIDIDLTGFSGIFNLSASGALGLSRPIAPQDASFGIVVSSAGTYNQYLNTADIALTSLTLGDINIPDGTYTRSDLPASVRQYVGDTTNTITVVSPTSGTNFAVAAGNLFSTATWGVAAPLPGDSQVWLTSTNKLESTSNGTETFNGSKFVIESGGTFSPGLDGDVTFNTMVLDGGLLTYNRNLTGTIRPSTLVLNSGIIKSGTAAGRPLNILGDGSIWGSGSINIMGNISATNVSQTGFVRFGPNVSMIGFSGKFLVSDYGTLILPSVSSNEASFSMQVGGTGRYQNDEDTAFTAVTLGGTALPKGVYDYDFFEVNGLAGYLVETNGTITVTEDTVRSYEQWAADNGLTAGVNDAPDYDVEPDGMDNLQEYALGGDPKVDDSASKQPSFGVVDVAGIPMVEYVYIRRADAAERNLDYCVLLGTDLIDDPATNNVGNTYEVDTGFINLDFESVTNRIPAAEATKFISLEVIQN